jgi:hypothetical protein
MNLKTRIAAGATAAVMAGILGLGGAGISTASAAPSAPSTAVAVDPVPATLPVTGTLPDGTIFTGQLSQLVATVVNGIPMLSGLITGTGLPAAPTPFDTVITGVTAACPVLNLDLQPLNLNLLGLAVNLDAVHLDINAVPGAGLLGDLVCALANALAPGGLLQQIVPILAAVLPPLGLAPIAPLTAPIAPPAAPVMPPAAAPVLPPVVG